MKIDLRIDRLVLDAALLEGGRADAVAAAIESELARLLTMPDAAGALRGIGAIDALPALTLATPPTDARAPNLGTQIARSLSDGLALATPSSAGDRASAGGRQRVEGDLAASDRTRGHGDARA